MGPLHSVCGRLDAWRKATPSVMSGPGHAMRVDRDAGLSALMAVVTVPVVGPPLLRSGPEGFAEALALPLVLAFAAPRWAVYLAAGIAAAAVPMAAGFGLAG